MDREEAKLHLAGYRPELYVGDDPAIAEALRLAESDLELSSWLDEQIQFDREMAGLLAAVDPPEGGREALLLDIGRSRGRRLVRRRLVLAAAAILLVTATAGVKYFLFPPAVEFAVEGAPTIDTFREQMAFFATERFALDKFYRDLSDSQSWLDGKGIPVFSKVPSKIVRYRGMGCKAIDWRGTKVGLVCFKNDAGQVVHLFVVDEADLEDFGSPATPVGQMAVAHGLETGGWRAEGKVLLLVGSEPGVPIGEFL